MALTDEQIEENGICKTCRGKGSWFDKGTIHYCEDCGGTGLEPSDGDVD